MAALVCSGLQMISNKAANGSYENDSRKKVSCAGCFIRVRSITYKSSTHVEGSSNGTPRTWHQRWVKGHEHTPHFFKNRTVPPGGQDHQSPQRPESVLSSTRVLFQSFYLLGQCACSDLTLVSVIKRSPSVWCNDQVHQHIHQGALQAQGAKFKN